MDVVLKGKLVVDHCACPKLYGPSGNEATICWLVINGLIVMLGRMEDEVLNPNKGIFEKYWDVDWMFVALVNGLDVAYGGREDVILLGRKGKYRKTRIRVVEASANGTIVVVWGAMWIRGSVMMG